MYRVFVYGFSAFVLAAVVSPAFRDPPADSFPLSDYPMFSAGRPDPMLELTHALGVPRDEGRRIPLSPLVAADNREVLQAMMTIWQGTMARPAAYCAEVAARVAASDDAELADVVAVELATSRFDTVAYFTRAPDPLSRHVHHRCDVPAGAAR